MYHSRLFTFCSCLLITMLFFGNVLPIHGSAIISENKNVFIFSGTGGIGKTFLEMSFILKDNYGFFADDIVLIGDNCSAFANYAFPKIYQYNVKQQTRQIFKKM